VRLLRWAWVPAVAALPFLQARIEAITGPFRAQEEVLYLSAQELRWLAPGFEDVMADLYWLRAVQYYGGKKAFTVARRFDLLLPLIDVTVTLDPRFEIAYEYGATFLAEPWPAGADQPQAAVDLLRRGVGNMPTSWQMRKTLGLFYFFFLKDAKRASEALLTGADLPGAPPWMRSLAGQVLVKGGERMASRQLWLSVYETSPPGSLRDNALLHLRYLDSLESLDRLQAALDQFAAARGRPARSLDELREMRLPAATMVDASGTPFKYDPATGQAFIGRSSPLWRPNLPGSR
jgi:hypothetical protein